MRIITNFKPLIWALGQPRWRALKSTTKIVSLTLISFCIRMLATSASFWACSALFLASFAAAIDVFTSFSSIRASKSVLLAWTILKNKAAIVINTRITNMSQKKHICNVIEKLHFQFDHLQLQVNFIVLRTLSLANTAHEVNRCFQICSCSVRSWRNSRHVLTTRVHKHLPNKQVLWRFHLSSEPEICHNLCTDECFTALDSTFSVSQ